mgnify:CR=1 FL=1
MKEIKLEIRIHSLQYDELTPQAHGLFSAPARRRTVEGVFGIR